MDREREREINLVNSIALLYYYYKKVISGISTQATSCVDSILLIVQTIINYNIFHL